MNSNTGSRRVALVTGASQGIGQAIAARLARDGLDVAIADLAPSTETERLISEAGGRPHSACFDVTDRAALLDFVSETTGALGAPSVVVANAGIYPLMPFLDTSWEVWRKVMDVNVDANYHLLQATVPAMIQSGWGRVIALASTVFHSGPPNTVAYAASKGAVIGIVRALASELGDHGITVNAVAPTIVGTPGLMDGPMARSGAIEMITGMQAIKRLLVPEEIAAAVSFLASDDAAVITGQTLPVDAGSVRA